jgi:hypothetical protein
MANDARCGVVERGQYDIVDDQILGMSASCSNSRRCRMCLYPTIVFRSGGVSEKLGGYRKRYGLCHSLNALGVMLTVPLEMNCAALGIAGGLRRLQSEGAQLPYATVQKVQPQVPPARWGAMIRAAEAILLKSADCIDRRAAGSGDFTPAERATGHGHGLCRQSRGEAVDQILYATALQPSARSSCNDFAATFV